MHTKGWVKLVSVVSLINFYKLTASFLVIKCQSTKQITFSRKYDFFFWLNIWLNNGLRGRNCILQGNIKLIRWAHSLFNQSQQAAVWIFLITPDLSALTNVPLIGELTDSKRHK